MGPGMNNLCPLKEGRGAGHGRRNEVDPAKEKNHRYLQLDHARQARLPIREAGYGLVITVDISVPAFVGREALVLAIVTAASSSAGV